MTAATAPLDQTIARDWRGEVAAMAALAGPIVLTQLTQMGIVLTDMAIIGRLGSEALASAALVGAVFGAFMFFAMGLLVPTSSLASQALGEQDYDRLARVIRQGLLLAIGFSLLAAFALGYIEPLMLLLGQDPAIAAKAAEYMSALRWTILPLMVAQVLRNFLSVLGQPKWSLVFMVGAFLLNLVLDLALILGMFGAPRLEVFGAGLASFLGTAITAVLFWIFCAFKQPFAGYWRRGGAWWPDWSMLSRQLRLGLPIGIAHLSEVGMFAIAVIIIGWYGSAQLAAHQIAINIASMTFMVPFGLAQAATVRVGHAFGRRDAESARRSGWTAVSLAVGFMALMGLVFWLTPRALVGLFLDLDAADTPAVIAHAASFLAVAAIFQIADGAQVVGAAALRGMNDTKVPMVFSLFGYWACGLGLSLVLGVALDLEGVGVWFGLAAGLTAVAAAMLLRFRTQVARSIPVTLPRV